MGFESEDEAYNFLIGGDKPIAKADGGSIKDQLTNDVYHGTTSPEFDQFKDVDPSDGYGRIATFLGTHVAKDPLVASNFAGGLSGNGTKQGRVVPLKTHSDEKFLPIKQPDLKNSSLDEDDNAIHKLVEKTVQKHDPKFFKAWQNNHDQMSKDWDHAIPDDLYDEHLRDISYKFSDIMKSKGYKGLKYQNTSPYETEGAKDKTCYIVFHHDPDQDDVAPLRGRFAAFDENERNSPKIMKAEGGSISDDPSMLSQPNSQPQLPAPTIVNDLGHYSEAIEQLKKLPQQKGTVGQFRKAIAGKVSPEEFKWSAFDEKFPDEQAKVDKSQLIGHFNQNLPKLKETVRHEDNKWVSGAKIEDLAMKAAKDPDLYDKILQNKGVHYDYHDTASEIEDYLHNFLKNNPSAYERATGEPLKMQPKYADYQSGGKNYREILLHVDHPEAQYQSSHWDEPNVLAHLRLNDHMGPNGEKLLHAEEIQSDWGQDARTKGLKSPQDTKAAEKQRQALKDLRESEENLKQARKTGDAGQIRKAEFDYYLAKDEHNDATFLAEEAEKRPSAAPFIHNTSKWTELAMKRLLKEAAEGNYDGVTLSSGDEQKQRWKAAPGADGLKSFYDDILPKTLEKVAKVHDKDARVGKQNFGKTYGMDIDRPFLPITPALKASVKRGQRMFKDGGKVEINLPSDERKKIIDKALNLVNGNRSTAASKLNAATGA